MWVVEFGFKSEHSWESGQSWARATLDDYAIEEEAETAMVLEVFKYPGWPYRIREVKD